MIITIGGKRYRLNYARMSRDNGTCDHPAQPGKTITIDPRILRDDRLHLETVLHELLHAAVWSLDEEFVAGYACDAARILHRLGFRYVGDPDGQSS